MASSKLITYDLCKSGKNYDDLYKYIKSYEVWARITESTWFVSTPNSCTQIRDDIRNILDSDDRVFVAELNGNAAWYNTICKSEYLKANL